MQEGSATHLVAFAGHASCLAVLLVVASLPVPTMQHQKVGRMYIRCLGNWLRLVDFLLCALRVDNEKENTTAQGNRESCLLTLILLMWEHVIRHRR